MAIVQDIEDDQFLGDCTNVRRRYFNPTFNLSHGVEERVYNPADILDYQARKLLG
jgi:hypothetical protein